MEHGLLTIQDVLILGEILTAAQRGSRVARAVDYEPGIITGTARSVGDEQGYIANNRTEVRDCFLRVTLVNGTDVYWPMRELMSEVRDGAICFQ